MRQKIVAMILCVMVTITIMNSETKEAEAAAAAVVPIAVAAIITAAFISAGLEFDTTEEAQIAVQDYWNDADQAQKEYWSSLEMTAMGTAINLTASAWNSLMGYTSETYTPGENTILGTKTLSFTEGAEWIIQGNYNTGNLAGYIPYQGGYRAYDVVLLENTSLRGALTGGLFYFKNYGEDYNTTYWTTGSGTYRHHNILYSTWNPATRTCTVVVTRCAKNGYDLNEPDGLKTILFHASNLKFGEFSSECSVLTTQYTKVYTAAEVESWGEGYEQPTSVDITALSTVADPNYTWVNPKTGDMAIAAPGTLENAISLTQSQVQNGEFTATIPIDVPIVELDDFTWPAFPADITIENITTWVGDIIKYAFMWLGSVLEMIIGLLKGLYYAALLMLQKIGAMTDFINPNSPNFFLTRFFFVPEGYWTAWYAALYAALEDKLPFMVFPAIAVPDQAFPTYTIELFGNTLTLVDGKYINEYGPTGKNVLSMGIWLLTFVSIWPKIAELVGQGGGSK